MNIEGTNAAETLNGTGSADVINGGAGDDVLNGLGGDDRLDGGSGADRMAGGSGDDVYIVDDDSTALEWNQAGAVTLQGDQVLENAGEGVDEVRSLVWLYTLPDNVENLTGTDARGQGLYGNALDNVITGFTGWDGLTDTAGGNDRLYGGDGGDGIAVSRYDNHAPSNLLLDGGDGDDVLTYSGSRYVDTVSLIGGAGDDNISIFRGGAVTIDAGAGADRIGLNFLGAQVVITLGAGSDRLIVQPELGFGADGGSITVTDFETGDSGDRFQIDYYLNSVIPGWDPATNIFGTGYVDLVQDGGDVVFRVDKDGPAGAGDFVDLVRFQNHQVADFTQFNLAGYAPDGGTPGGVTRSGGPGNDILWGTFEDDILLGLDGHDELNGGAGDDRLEGGAGRDFLDGQFGTDLLFGGDGHDALLDDEGGNDQLFGGDDWDDILVTRVGDGPATTVLLDGGNGGDRIFFTALGRGGDIATVRGGEGNDDIFINGRSIISVDGGAGDDYVGINISSGLYKVALGAGYDQLYLGAFPDRDPGGPDLYDARLFITDFAAGEFGPATDVLFVRDYLKAVLPDWDGVSDLFAAGYLELLQDGPDAVVRLDVDGPSGDDSGREFIRLKGVDAGTLTAYNLNDLKALSITGSDFGETITAAAGNHQLEGLGGNDRLSGGAGDDRLDGGDGNDQLFAGTGSDALDGGAGNDVLYFGAAFTGADVADGGSDRDVVILQGDYSLALSATNLTGVESLSLQSGSRATWGDIENNYYDYDITTHDANVAAGQQLIVNAQSLRAGEDFSFDGSAETDGYFLVYGGHGVDTLKGGAGNDAFFFEGDRWGAGDSVDGGLGRDALIISAGNGITHIEFGATSIAGIESISLNARYATDPTARPSYELVLANGNVFPGATLIVNGSSLADRSQTVSIDGSAVHDGNLILFGGFGNDTLKGGDGADLIQGGEGIDELAGAPARTSSATPGSTTPPRSSPTGFSTSLRVRTRSTSPESTPTCSPPATRPSTGSAPTPSPVAARLRPVSSGLGSSTAAGSSRATWTATARPTSSSS
ncbi:MAG: hypothetical protein QOG72_3043 [Sphingomonadales bacterium]|nr:hypothetical protein [Sphingomonadales bacterium]